jgi:hypothetical protein
MTEAVPSLSDERQPHMQHRPGTLPQPLPRIPPTSPLTHGLSSNSSPDLGCRLVQARAVLAAAQRQAVRLQTEAQSTATAAHAAHLTAQSLREGAAQAQSHRTATLLYGYPLQIETRLLIGGSEAEEAVATAEQAAHTAAAAVTALETHIAVHAAQVAALAGDGALAVAQTVADRAAQRRASDRSAEAAARAVRSTRDGGTEQWANGCRCSRGLSRPRPPCKPQPKRQISHSHRRRASPFRRLCL